MRSLKITITLLTLVTLGIVVGSNLSELMAVVILSQPTVALPIGLWLIIAIGLGLLSSSSIQLLLFLQQRSLSKKVRKLQQRLQEQDEDIFTYRSATPEDLSETEAPNPQIKRNRFSFQRRVQVNSEPSSTTARSTSPIEDDVNDWEDEPRANRQLDWDDVPPAIPQPHRAQPAAYANPRPVESRFTSTREPELARNDEVYDADFRLIQPPYKQAQPESEYSEYAEDEDELEYDEEEEFEPPATIKESKFTDRSNRQSDRLDDEDWGFDFDDEGSRTSKSKPQRI
jgi:hypothetical protein